MSGLGGLNKAPDGVVIGVVQLQNPWLVTQEDLVLQTERICRMVRKARDNMPTMDLVVFPEYAPPACPWTPIRRLCADSTAPRSRAFAKPASTTGSGAAFQLWSSTPAATHLTAA